MSSRSSPQSRSSSRLQVISSVPESVSSGSSSVQPSPESVEPTVDLGNNNASPILSSRDLIAASDPSFSDETDISSPLVNIEGESQVSDANHDDITPSPSCDANSSDTFEI